MFGTKGNVVCAALLINVMVSGASASELLDGARQATEGLRASGLQLTGASEFLGAPGEYTLTLAPDGRFEWDIRGELSQLQTYDGESYWERDWQGVVRELVLGERDFTMLGVALLNGQWAAEDGPLEFTESPTSGDTLPFRMRDGLLEGSITLNDERLPARVTTMTPGATYTLEYLEYETAPAPHPTLIKVTTPAGDVTTLRVDSANVPAATTTFARPIPDVDRISWSDAEGPVALEFKQAPTGHHLVKALVNGKDYGWFIFDSGAGATVLTPRIIEAERLPTIGSLHLGGVGGAVLSDLVRADTLTVGPLTLRDTVLVTMDLSFLDAHFGVPVAGIVGYDVLAWSAVEIDFDAPSISIMKTSPAIDTWVDALTADRLPCVSATAEGHTGIYRLDTGAAQETVSFHAPAVERLDMLDDRETTERTSGGVGGRVPMRVGKIASFTVAGHEWLDLPATFATQSVGAFGDPYTDGNIGGVLLKRWNLVFDYPNGRIGFVNR
jgi:hypothetical protein